MNKLDKKRFDVISSQTGIEPSVVKSVVYSYFNDILRCAKKLPFDNKYKIYSKAAFDEYIKVWNIPYIGRIGTIYSRYKKWRINESKHSSQEYSDKAVSRKSDKYDIERLAFDILSGKAVSVSDYVKQKEKSYKPVWFVESSKKKRKAKQVIKIKI